MPSVPRMFRYYFDDADAVLADPRGLLVIADGRNYVNLSDRRYDLIVADPPPPMENPGTSVLYSREFYQAVQQRLTPGGVMLQLMSADQSIDEFRDHVRTFAAVFPQVTLVLDAVGDVAVFFLGSDAPLTFDPLAMEALLGQPAVADDLALGIDAPVRPAAVWREHIERLVWLSDDEARQFAGPGPLITDDHPLPEYFLLRRLRGPASPRVQWAHGAPTIPLGEARP